MRTVDMLQTHLTGSGARVIGAGSVRAALPVVDTFVLDGVLVDLRMPDEDGWWLLRELRSSQTPSAQAPVFAASGDGCDVPDQADGFAGYFLKPIDLDALIAKLAMLPWQSQAPMA